jgi:hypothetical protein
MTRMAGVALSEQAAPFMAALADPSASRDQQELAAIQLSELMNLIKKMPPESPEEKALRMRELLLHSPGSDPRDYRIEPGLWRSELLPLGVSIDQAVKSGVWQ